MKHKERVRKAVMHVAYNAGMSKDGAWQGFFTVGEIFPDTEYSRPTVQKYVDELCNEGVFSMIRYEKSARLYRLENV